MIRYSELGYVALNVSDLDRSADFYRDVVGLQQIAANSADLRLFRCSGKHHDIVLFKGEPGVKRVGFELESNAQLEPLSAALRAAGRQFRAIDDSDRRAMSTGEGIRTWEPGTGCALDFYVAGDVRPSATPYAPTEAKILRLGHIVLSSKDYQGSLRYLTGVLNFKVSDSIDGRVSFMRCFPSPYHHSLGLGNGAKSGNRMNHVALMVNDIDDIGRSYWRLQRAGVTVVHGPGRHLPSGSVFLYFLDPDGLTLEYTLGMEEFPEVDPREPRHLPPVPQSNDIWTSAMDPRKGAIGAIEQSEPAVAAG